MTARRIEQQNDHLSNDFVEVDQLALRRPSPVERAISLDDAGGTLYVVDNSRYPLASLLNLGWLALQPWQAGSGIYCGCGYRLPDLVTQRCSQFSHHTHAVDAREICLQLAQSFALLFSAPAFGDVVVGLQGGNRRTPRISLQ